MLSIILHTPCPITILFVRNYWYFTITDISYLRGILHRRCSIKISAAVGRNDNGCIAVKLSPSVRGSIDCRESGLRDFSGTNWTSSLIDTNMLIAGLTPVVQCDHNSLSPPILNRTDKNCPCMGRWISAEMLRDFHSIQDLQTAFLGAPDISFALIMKSLIRNRH